MKKIFTLAIALMIASLSFAQAPKATKALRPFASVADKEVLKTIPSNFSRAIDFNAMANAGHKVTPKSATEPTIDANGIIIAPPTDAVVKYYKRTAGYGYYPSNNQVQVTTQSGKVEVYEMENGDVYILSPLSQYTTTTYVKGTKQGDKLVVPARQPLTYVSQYSTTLSMRWGNYDPNSTEGFIPADDHADNFEFEIDADQNLTLLGTTSVITSTTEAYFMGLYWDDDNTFQGYGDAETVLNYDPGYVPTPKDPTVPPTGLVTETWYLNGQTYSSTPVSILNREVKVGFDGDDVYVQGLHFTNFPNAWIKGTINGDEVTFPKFQYYGVYGGSFDIWFTSIDNAGNLADGVATISADKKTITLSNEFFANAADDRVYYLEGVDAASTISAEKFIPSVEVGTAELPYMNSFDGSTAQANGVAIYDANADGKTFAVSSKQMRYSRSTSKAADDYVVMPGFELQAGKSYKIALDVKGYSSTKTEKFEVVYSKDDLHVDQFTNVAMPVQEIKSTSYANKTVDFEPTEDGVYYFAVHCVSAANQGNYFYFDNFAVTKNIVKDLSVTVAPVANPVELGESAVVKAVVANQGSANAEAGAYSLKITAGNELLAEYTGEAAPAIASLGNAEFTVELPSSVFDAEGEVALNAQVTYEGDEDLTNNEASSSLTFVKPSVAAPEDASASVTADGILVQITLPSFEPTQLDESFEDYENQSIYDNNGANLTMGPWSAHDGDKGTTYGWSGSSYWQHSGKPYAFGIIQPSGLGIEAKSGEQVVMFMSNSGKKNDDYMISPMLPGVAQTLTFSAMEITDEYGAEKFELLVSSTDDAIESFSLLQSFELTSDDWKDLSFELPEGTKHFAIHYISNDVFCAFIDDLHVLVGQEKPSAVKVYLDGELSETIPYEVEQTESTLALKGSIVGNVVSTTLTDVEPGDHAIAATLVYGTKESAPVVTTITTTGVDDVKVSIDLTNGEIYNLNGARVSSKNVNGGVYIIGGKKVLVK